VEGELVQMMCAFKKMIKANPGMTMDDVVKSTLKCPPGGNDTLAMEGKGENKNKCANKVGAKITGKDDESYSGLDHD
jgi:hypothetical protein